MALASRPFLDVDRPATGVLRVCINNPAKRNAISRVTMRHLAELLKGAEAQDDILVFLLTSKVPGVFSSGADISADITDPGDGFDELVRALVSFPKILAIAVNGLAVGVAVTILGHADLAWCTEGARFTTPFGRLALAPEASSSLVFPARLGRPLATEVLLTGRPLTSGDALRCGLVASVLANEAALEAEALACAARISSLHAARRTVAVFKRLFNAPVSAALLGAHEGELRELRSRFVDGEPVEAALRYFEERSRAVRAPGEPTPRL